MKSQNSWPSIDGNFVDKLFTNSSILYNTNLIYIKYKFKSMISTTKSWARIDVAEL